MLICLKNLITLCILHSATSLDPEINTNRVHFHAMTVVFLRYQASKQMLTMNIVKLCNRRVVTSQSRLYLIHRLFSTNGRRYRLATFADLIKKCKHEHTIHTQSGVTNLSNRTEQM